MQFLNLSKQRLALRGPLRRAVERVLNRGAFILGEEGATLEHRIADLTRTRYAVGVNSGTDALYLSLQALGIKSGDEVIITPFTFVATAEVIANLGARPVFVDINSRTYNIDATKIERVVTKRTRAIIPVHLYGQMADMQPIMHIAKHKRLAIIEDSAQALGASQVVRGKRRMAGSLGNVGCFSFFPTKNLGAYGDAGMAVTNDARPAEVLRLLRNHGSRKKYHHEVLGVSSRLDELQAAMLLAKLPYLRRWNMARRRIAAQYTRAFSGIPELRAPVTNVGSYHIFHQYTVRTHRRDALQSYLEHHGIPTAIHYPLPLHLQPAFKYLGYHRGDFPEAERAAREALSLPIYPELRAAEQAAVARAVTHFFTSEPA